MIIPSWPAPEKIHAGITTREVNDYSQLNFPQEAIFTPKQIHSAKIILLDDRQEKLNSSNLSVEADGLISSEAQKVCAVRTADCLPILLCDKSGKWMGAIHAGWKGIKAGIIENGLEQLPVSSKDLWVWLGPSISKKYYEVGEDMRSQFSDNKDKSAFEKKSSQPEKYFCDLTQLARNRLEKYHITSEQIFTDNYCTYRDKSLFYSYRREGVQTGRMLSFIWREA